jgi:hypothetical protein
MVVDWYAQAKEGVYEGREPIHCYQKTGCGCPCSNLRSHTNAHFPTMDRNYCNEFKGEKGRCKCDCHIRGED